MRKFIEHFLLSVLVSLSILLGLTFWLYSGFRFNLFSAAHWNELAAIQASGAPIDKSFYISIGVAIFIFVLCMHIIYRPRFRKISLKTPQKIEKQTLPATIVNEKQEEKPMTTEKEAPKKVFQPVPKTVDEPKVEQKTHLETTQQQSEKYTLPQSIALQRPPKLNLPKNIEQIAAMQYNNQKMKEQQEQMLTQYDDTLNEIFSNTAYLVKKNSTLAGLKTNLIAIGNKEIFWIGSVDCDINKMKTTVNKLKETFQQTLEDIPINVFPFILDTKKIYDGDPDVLIFHDIEEIRKFIFEHQGTDIDPEFQEDFDAYSEYIDTVLSLLSSK